MHNIGADNRSTTNLYISAILFLKMLTFYNFGLYIILN